VLLNGITDNDINQLMESNLSRVTIIKLLLQPNLGWSSFAYWYPLVIGISYGRPKVIPLSSIHCNSFCIYLFYMTEKVWLESKLLLANFTLKQFQLLVNWYIMFLQISFGGCLICAKATLEWFLLGMNFTDVSP
jgi:hypothetical protein